MGKYATDTCEIFIGQIVKKGNGLRQTDRRR